MKAYAIVLLLVEDDFMPPPHEWDWSALEVAPHVKVAGPAIELPPEVVVDAETLADLRAGEPHSESLHLRLVPGVPDRGPEIA